MSLRRPVDTAFAAGAIVVVSAGTALTLSVGMGWSSPNPVEPTAGQWRMTPAPAPQAYVVTPPPANDSTQTLAELKELEALTHNRMQADIDQINYWASGENSPLTHWGAMADEMAGKYHLSPPAGARLHAILGQALESAVIACWNNKYKYLRPRPTMLDPFVDASVVPVPEHPSYPAGHACVAGAASTVFKQFFAQDAYIFDQMARESEMSRMKAGLHFRSDIDQGHALGTLAATTLLKEAAQDGAPMTYTR